MQQFGAGLPERARHSHRSAGPPVLLQGQRQVLRQLHLAPQPQAARGRLRALQRPVPRVLLHEVLAVAQHLRGREAGRAGGVRE